MGHVKAPEIPRPKVEMTEFEHKLFELLFGNTGTEELSIERLFEVAKQMAPEALKAAREELMKEIWHKGSNPPENRHPYPVINPDTQEMAFAYYEQRFGQWEFDRDYDPGINMFWMDIEKIIPGKEKIASKIFSKLPSRPQEEPVSEDLEEAAAQSEMKQGRLLFPYRKGFKDGAQWQKQQMIKAAVESILYFDYGDRNGFYGMVELREIPMGDMEDGDKVKIIVIKED